MIYSNSISHPKLERGAERSVLLTSWSRSFSSLTLTGIVAFSFLMAHCGGAPPSGPRGNALVYARGGDAVTLDTGSMEEGFSSTVATQIFEGLVKFKEDSMEVEPCLATSWEPSEDNLTWTFHLRENVQFHDGTPFNAQAVVTSLMRMIDPANPYHLPGKMPFADFAYKGIVKEVKAVDDKTVQIVLERPYAPLLQNLAMFCSFIISPAALEQYKEDIGSHPVGTGPFRFESWKRDVEIVLPRNDNYWGEKAKVETLIYKTIRDPDVRLISLSRGEADIMDGIEPQMVSELAKYGDLQLHKQVGINVSYGIINVKAKPFDDKRVRQAANYAVNKQAICEHLFENLAIPCNGIFPPGVLGHAPDLKPYEYNVEKAKALLKEAGYENGLEFELLTYSVPRPYNPMGARLAEAVQSDLAKVGMKANIVQVEFGTLLERTLAHNFQLAMLGWITDNGDPDNYAYALLAYPENRHRFAHEEFNRLTLAGQSTYDPAQRLELYRQAQQIAIEEAPWLFLNHFDDLAVTSKRVQNFRLHPSQMHHMWGVSLAEK